MANHGSATVRETPHANRTSRTNTIVNALKRRAQAVLNDKSIDPESRTIIRYALETHDPWLAELVRRAEAGEAIDDTLNFEETPETHNDDSEMSGGDSRGNKLSVLIDIICRSGDEPKTKSAALLVLMAIIEKSTYPAALASAAKCGAYMRCADPNLHSFDDDQVEMLARRLLAENGYSF